MKTMLIGSATALLLLQNCVAPPDETRSNRDETVLPTPATTVTESGPTAVPAQVTGLQAVFMGSKIKLTWNRVEDAFAYEIYREKKAIPGAAPDAALSGAPRDHQANEAHRPPRPAGIPGTRLDRVAETDYVDYTLDLGNTYTYRVAAINRIGVGPASQAVQVQVVQAPLFPGWFRAPGESPTNENPDAQVDWNAAIGAQGGDQGLATSTEFAVAATKYTGCTGDGVALGKVRPALDSRLPSGPQTIALDLNYNFSAAGHKYVIFATAVSMGGDKEIPIYLERGVFAGCGTKQLAFTADFSVMDPASVIFRLIVHDESPYHVISHVARGWLFESGNWLALEETVPEAGATLPSAGTLAVRIRHHRLQNTRLTVRLDGDYFPVFGSAVTDVGGTGDFIFHLPYEAECGSETATLRIWSDLDYAATPWALEYSIASTTAPKMLAGVSDLWKSSYYARSYFTYTTLNVSSCGSMPIPVTLAASPGWRIYHDTDTGEEYGTVVTGMSDDDFKLDYDPAAPKAYGTVTGTAIATFPSGVTRAAQLRLHIFDYFWETTPPASPLAGVDYPVAVTVAGPRPDNFLYLNVRGQWDQYFQQRMPWSAAANAFTSAVNFPLCGDYESYAGASYADTSDLYSTVSTGATLMLETPEFYIDASDEDPASYELVGACGETFTWTVVFAPAWMRFQSLSGSSTAPLVAGVETSEAFPSDEYFDVWGSIGIRLNGEDPIFEIDVLAYR